MCKESSTGIVLQQKKYIIKTISGMQVYDKVYMVRRLCTEMFIYQI